MVSEYQLVRFLLTGGNFASFFVLTVANAPGFNIPFIRANIKLLIPFFTTFTYIMNVSAVLAIDNTIENPEVYPEGDGLSEGGRRVYVYFIV